MTKYRNLQTELTAHPNHGGVRKKKQPMEQYCYYVAHKLLY